MFAGSAKTYKAKLTVEEAEKMNIDPIYLLSCSGFNWLWVEGYEWALAKFPKFDAKSTAKRLMKDRKHSFMRS